MYVVGVTGGIGSGKSAVTKRFQQNGITVVDADIVSRIIVEPGRPAIVAIEDHFGTRFGKTVIHPNGTLDRRALRDIVFGHPDERLWLEQLTHPLIAGEIETRLACSQSPYTILVSPLLLEGDQKNMVNRILVVDAPETLQIQRTVERDSTTAAGVEAIMQAQMPRQQRLQHADDVIVNDSTLDALHQAVDQLHNTYLQQARHHTPPSNLKSRENRES